ncbi:NUDIX hydrolase [Xylanimonas oleitrophica]|uniref:NUDIX hydrolase n=1 Tax=Xylanimonas oleitrophica TaxID=2607479 RepID=UPI003CCC5CC3
MSGGPVHPGGGAGAAGWDDGSADHRFRVVPAAYVYLRREGQVLLQLRRGTGYRDGHWAAAAAGHVEPGESVVQAAVREAREELGVEVDEPDLRPVTVMHRGQPGGPALEQRVDVFFEAHRWAGTPTLLESAKAADLRWFPFVALPEPVVPHELRVLRALRDASRGSSHEGVPRLMVDGF